MNGNENFLQLEDVDTFRSSFSTPGISSQKVPLNDVNEHGSFNPTSFFYTVTSFFSLRILTKMFLRFEEVEETFKKYSAEGQKLDLAGFVNSEF